MRRAVAAGIAIALAGAVAPLLSSRLAGPRGRESAPTAPDAGAPDAAGRPGLRAAKPGVAAGSAADAPLPAAVDLAQRDRDLDLFGVVVTKDGAPVAGADLRAISYPTRRANLLDRATYDAVAEGPGTRSAADGTFSLRLRRGERVLLRVEAAGFGRFERPGCTAGQRLRIVLEPAVTLVVALKDEEGKPVPETNVRIFRPDYAAESSFQRRERTDAEGRAAFGDLPPRVWTYIDPEPAVLGKVTWKTVELPAEGRLVVEVVLPAGRTVTGRVTDAATNAPIPGAKVGINWTLGRPQTTDADGRFRLTGWNDRQGAIDLHAVAEGYGRRGIVVGAKEVVDFELERGDSVIGRAVDAAGRPVPDAIVGVVAVGAKAGSVDGDILGTMRTGPDGRFRMTSLRRDQEHALVLMATGYGRTLLDFEPRAAGAGEIDLGDVAMPRARSIEGRVLTADGAAIADAAVSLHGANWDQRRLLGNGPSTRDYLGYGSKEEARTDDLGRYRFPDLAPGTYQLTSAPPGRQEAKRIVGLGAEKDVLDADLVHETGRQVTIFVSDPAGAPLSGARVRVEGTSAPVPGQGLGGTSDANGEVRVTLPPGEWAVSVYWSHETDAKGRRFLQASARPLPADVARFVVPLAEAVAIAGRVVDPEGGGVENLVIEAVRGSEVVGTGQSLAGGRFSVDLPKGGRVALRVGRFLAFNGASPQPWAGELADVEPGASDVTLPARLPPKDVALTVRVLSPEGRPVPEARVYVSSASGPVQAGRTNAAGSVTFWNLKPGRWSIVADLGASPALGRDWLPARAEVADPGGAEVEARFRVAVPLAGTVLDAEGRPAPEFGVQVLAAGTHAGSARTDASGRFRVLMDPDAPRPIRVRVSAPGRDPEDFDVPSPPAEDLTLRLKSAAPR